MIAKLGESVGSKLGERIVALLATGPAAYLTAAYALWLIERSPAAGLKATTDWIGRQTPTALITYVVVGILLVQGAAAVVNQCVLPATRLLEGYWPRPFAKLTARLSTRAWKKRNTARDELRALSPTVAVDGVLKDEAKFVKADRHLHRTPGRAAWTLPTRLGNTLRAGETRPVDKYGLDPIKVWPATWLGLPDEVRTELVGARKRLDATVAGLLWCLIGVSLVVIVWWAAPIAVAAAVLAYYVWVLPAAADYADLFEATFDTQRTSLYESLRLAAPESTADDRASGLTITRYLWQGWPDEPEERLTYTDGQDDEDTAI